MSGDPVAQGDLSSTKVYKTTVARPPEIGGLKIVHDNERDLDTALELDNGPEEMRNTRCHSPFGRNSCC